MKRIIFIITIMLGMFTLPNTILADNYTVFVGNENIYVDNGVKSNSDGTASYNASTKTLTLNNYNGGVIASNINSILKINLIGTNKIDGDGEDFEGIYIRKGIDISGSGTLTIIDTSYGIYSDNGDITITNAIIDINGTTTGIYTNNGDIILNGGKINIENASDGIEAYAGENDKGNIDINSVITIDVESEGIYALNNLTINGGNINVKGDYSGIVSMGLKINKGKVVINSGLIGVGSNSFIVVNGGYTSIKTSDDGIAIFVVSEDNPRFTIASNLEVLPKGLSFEEDTFEVVDDVTYTGITLGTKGASVDLSDGVVFKNVATEVIISEVVPNTCDNIYSIVIICLSSLLGLILLIRKVV